ncbi:hypothetical protein BJV78DRAFT_542695 [Lactifluus subvellereus]|nr:hypothetical protein BJV78DRAFT_542695 [Lactifluus subvellereus]
MVSVLKILLECLRRFRFLRGYSQRCSAHWASFLAFIYRRLGLWRLWHKKPCTFRKARPAEPSFPSVGARGYSVPGSSPNFREYAVAASAVPASASVSSLHDQAPRQTTMATPSGTFTPPVQTSLAADHAPSAYEDRHTANPSSANLSTHSRASSRLAILTQSRESLRASSPVGEASRDSRATYRRFGRGPDPSRSRERPLRPPSTINRHPIYQLPHPESDTTNILPATSSVLPPSPSSHTQPLSPPSDHSSRRRWSSESVDVTIQHPSTESLAPPSSPPSSTNEPLASSPVTNAPEIHEELSQPRLTAPSVISDLYLPEGRFLQLIHSDQIPRYSKENTIPRDETPYYVRRLTTEFP